jgi:CheY-specific phosphatase CheX
MEAMRHQRSGAKRIGEIAVEKGWLDEESADFINGLQFHTDQLFCDIAIEMGYLDSGQARKLIRLQRQGFIPLEQALTELGFLADEEVSEKLSLYFAEDACEPGSGSVVRLDEDLTNPLHRDFFLTLADQTIKMMRRVADTHCRAMKIKVERSYTINPAYCVTAATQGDVSVNVLFKLFSELAASMAARMLKVRKGAPIKQALIEDAMKEFLNIICGQVLASLASRGIEFQFSVPDVIRSSTDGFVMLRDEERSIILPLISSEGCAEIHMIETVFPDPA